MSRRDRRARGKVRRRSCSEIFGTLTPWQRVHMARHPQPPDCARLHRRARRVRRTSRRPALPRRSGDRRRLRAAARPAASWRSAQQRGRDTKENLRRNFGMPQPEGYRKVERLAHWPRVSGLPIVTFVDTTGADPGIASEEHAQSEAIAHVPASLRRARRCRSSQRSSAKAAAAARSRWRSPTT